MSRFIVVLKGFFDVVVWLKGVWSKETWFILSSIFSGLLFFVISFFLIY
jgi:hypothetical protein